MSEGDTNTREATLRRFIEFHAPMKCYRTDTDRALAALDALVAERDRLQQALLNARPYVEWCRNEIANDDEVNSHDLAQADEVLNRIRAALVGDDA